jgi:hypothetical protein
MFTVEGTHYHIGRTLGTTYAAQVHANLRVLVHRIGYTPLPLDNTAFVDWMQRQERLIAEYWPWLIDEMQGIADGAGADFRDILLLNLRPWQWDDCRDPSVHCSSLVVHLQNGTVANAGTLDDSREYYCDPLRIVPESGYRFITIPVAGTSWGMRAFNSAGLAIGISSQLLPGLRPSPDAINQDLATRVIAQSCATVDEVRQFCARHPFNQNLVCSDARGGVFCAHATAAGVYELSSSAPYCLTNHIVSDEIRTALTCQGVRTFADLAQSQARRMNLLHFLQRDSQCCADDVRAFIITRDDADPGSITTPGTIVATYANPQVDPGGFWIADPNGNAFAGWTRVVV